ncbi:RING finger protein [Blastomyces dermatitidis ER-3]|nr:RING finger protein [Blastomyces dermatitidis ER-3]EEQ91048.1 RING finger protein [Blastomyces dermatitidis ER-3]
MKRKLTEIIDLTGDDENGAIKVPRSSGASRLGQPRARSTSPQNRNDQMYARVATIFPSISFKYVGQLYKRLAFVNPGVEVEEALVHLIMDLGPYPKEEEEEVVAKLEKLPQNIPRKSQQSTSSKRAWGRDDGVIRGKSYYRDSQYLLEQNFPKIRPEYIRFVLQSQKSLFAAYASLDESENIPNMTNPLPLHRQRSNQGPVELVRQPDIPMNSDILRELQDALEERRKREESRQREKELAKLDAEKEATCIAQGNVMECKCCYTDVPIIHMIPCAGENIHFFCKECVRSTAKSQIGVMKYEVNCMDISGCGAGFDKQILAKVLGDPLMKKLEQLQQRDEIARAELEGLHDCPFCDFKAICPPIEMGDCQFYCQNPACRKVSCRRCGLAAHSPQTCEQANDKKTPARQKIEEAMSEALIRTCPNPKCKVKIIKEDGCNKMTCVKCRSVMCYVCKKAITTEGYRHFNKRPNSCPLHDGRSNSRHFEEVSSAHKKAIDEVMKANPQLNIEELAVEAPKNEHHKSVDHRRYLQHLRNQQQHYNDLLRRRQNPGAPANPAQPGAAGPAHVPMYAAVNHNHPLAVAYPQAIPVPNGANQFLHFRGDMEQMNTVEQPPHPTHQPIVRQDPQQPHIWNHGWDFHFIPPAAAPVPVPFPHVPSVHPQQYNHGHHQHYHYQYDHLGYPVQGTPMPQQRVSAARKDQNQNQNQNGNQNQNLRLNQPRDINQAQQHSPPQPQLKNPQGPPKFRIHSNLRFPLSAPPPAPQPVMSTLPNSFGPIPSLNPHPQWNQQLNKPLVMRGVPDKTQSHNQTVLTQPSPLPTQPTHMQARPAVPGQRIASNNNININHTNNNNNNNNDPHHINRPIFRYPVDVPDRGLGEFPYN